MNWRNYRIAEAKNSTNACHVEYSDIATDVIVSTGITRRENKKYWHVEIFGGKAKKNAQINTIYYSHERALQTIEAYVNRARKLKQDKKQQAVKTKSEKMAFFESLNVGDIFVRTWGYEQTNVDAVQIVSIKNSRNITVREIGFKTVSGSEQAMSDTRKPVKNHFLNDKEYKAVVSGNKRLSVSGDRFFKSSENETYYCSWYY